MERSTLIICLVGAFILVGGLITALVFLVASRSGEIEAVSSEQTSSRVVILKDKFAGKEAEAIELVKHYSVLNPEYIDAYIEARESGKASTVPRSTVTLEELVDKQFLEDRFNMHFLQKGEWRALHLDTDSGETQTPDPQYEVYLDYQDEAITVGPVWIVDIETKVVIPRNDMASVFDRNEYNYKAVAENIKRPENVIKAITSHKFETGIDLGGVFLLHFMELTKDPKHAEDEIIGWTVMQEFEDEFSAYFQWRELGEVRVAKFKFDWKNKSLEPKGLRAIDLMNIGETMDPVKAVSIYPNEYTNNLGIPRKERWPKKHSCRSKDYQQLCTAFVKVLEQQEFINALGWLLTKKEADATHRVERCKEAHNCMWVPRLAPDSLNPDKRTDLFEIDYIYEDRNEEKNVASKREIKFLVDSEKETIKPLDKFSQWAYYSVNPRT